VSEGGESGRWPPWLQWLRPRRATHRWERNWSSGKPHRWELGAVSRPFLEAFESGMLRSDERCLDVGCSLGHSSAWLASRGMRVTGIDVSDSVLREARRRHAATPRLAFRQADVTRPCEGLGSFRAIVDRGCLHALPLERWPAYFANIAEWLEPMGVFLLQHKRPPEGVIALQERLERCLPSDMNVAEVRRIDMLEGTAADAIQGVLFVIRRS